MALVSAKEMVDKAHEGHYAIPAFNINDLEWTKAVLAGIQQANSPAILQVSEGAGKYMAVAICILVAIHYAENLGLSRDNTVPAVALASFVTLINTTATSTMKASALVAASGDVLALGSKATDTSTVPVSIGAAVQSSYTSANGLFVGLIVGILATLLYVKLIQGGKLKITLPDSVPPNVAQSFAVLFPAVITIFVVSLVGFLVSLTGTTFFGVITAIFAPLKVIMAVN
jgi:Fructose/tagatose bisphosphate aldolase